MPTSQPDPDPDVEASENGPYWDGRVTAGLVGGSDSGRGRRILALLVFILGTDLVMLGGGVIFEALTPEPTNLLLGLALILIVVTPVLFLVGLGLVWRRA